MGSDKVYARGRHGSVRSCPTRTLDKYPMKYSQKDLSKSVLELRSAKSMASQDEQLLLRSSMNQKDYSKRLFQDAVNKGSGSIGGSTCSETEAVICEVFKLTNNSKHSNSTLKYSGPTNFGSPLYNKRPELMSQLRTKRSQPLKSLTQTGMKPFWIDLRQHMKQANDYYTVERKENDCDDRSPTMTFSDGSCKNCYNLIPLKKSEADIEGESVQDVEEEINQMTIGEEPEENVIPVVMLVGPEDEPAEGNAEHDEVVIDVGEFLAEDNKTRPASARNRESSAKIRPISPRSKSATSHQKSGKVPRCWVDDATVSSEGSHTKEESPESNNLLSIPGKKKSRSKAGSKSKSGSVRSFKSRNSSRSKHSVRGKKKDVQRVTIKDEVSLVSDKPTEEKKTDEYEFPDFICPSSEEKSREAAVKNWLANVNFPVSARHVPLM